MNTHHMLAATLNEILYVINPLREDIETRMRIIDDLRDAVSTLDSLRGATVEPFGSFLSQLFTRWGDLDISIELTNGSHILAAAKKHKQMLLGDVLKALRRTGKFKKLQFVSHARVPILKLESRCDSISCDISINNLSGQMKSKFLLWISLIDRRFRDMVLLVKEWAKANGINSSKHGTFNSYSLSLLVIFHFQTCTPPILPPLKDLYPGNMADELIGIRADVEKRIEEVAIANIARFRKERRDNHCSLSELFISFLGKFSDISTRAADHGVCTYSGHWENISTNTRWLPRTYAIFIEDPFEQPQNSARAVARGQLTRIGEVFRNTYFRLMDPNQSRNTLIPSLVPHEIFHFFPGAAFLVPRANVRPYLWTNQNAPRGNYPSSGFQHQYRNRRQVNNLNSQKVQNGKQPSRQQAQAAQIPREKPGSQPQNANRLKAAPQIQGQVQVLPQLIRPPLAHTLQPSQANNVASQSVKASPAQAQQAWRPKQFNKQRLLD